MFAPAAGAGRARCGRRFRPAFCLICVLSPGLASAQDAVKGGKEIEGLPPAPVPVVSTEIITRIEFFGNRITQDHIMRQEMSIKEGDVADPAKIEHSRQAIMDLGLFKSVRVILEPFRDGVVLRITVKEKLYILPTPKLNRDDENKNYSRV